jgi:hypothetical protein
LCQCAVQALTVQTHGHLALAHFLFGRFGGQQNIVLRKGL